MNYVKPFAFSLQRWYNADALESTLAHPEVNLARMGPVARGIWFQRQDRRVTPCP